MGEALVNKAFFYFSSLSFIFLYINSLFHLSLAQNHRVPIPSARSLITSFAPPQAPLSPFHPEAKKTQILKRKGQDHILRNRTRLEWNASSVVTECSPSLAISPRNAQSETWQLSAEGLNPTRITSSLSFSVPLYLIRFLFLQNTNKLGLCQAAGLQMLRGECGLEVLGKGESRLELQGTMRTESPTRLPRMNWLYDLTL